MKALKILRTLLTATGILCFLGAAYLCTSEIRFKRHAVDVQGMVLRYDGGLTYAYEYPAGKLRKGKTHASSSDWTYAGGDPIDLQVDLSDPDRAQIKGFVDQWLGVAMLSFFAVIFGAPGFGMILYALRKNQARSHLRNRGRTLVARVSTVALNESLSINGRSPFIIHAEARLDGKIHAFKSDNLWFDPTPYLETDQVRICHLPENPKVYCMDISFLPQLAT